MWILKVWSQLSGKTPGNFPGSAPLSFFFVGIWHTVLRFPLFLAFLSFVLLPHPPILLFSFLLPLSLTSLWPASNPWPI